MVINNHQCPAGEKARLSLTLSTSSSPVSAFYLRFSILFFYVSLFMVGGVACSVGRCAVVEIPCRMSIYLWSCLAYSGPALFGFRPGLVGVGRRVVGSPRILTPSLSLSLSTTDDDFFYVMWHGKA